MKIAVTYDNGMIFEHFGRTEAFKVYEVEDGQVLSSEVISSNGSGHSALAGLLAQQEIHVLICGGLGQGAQNALSDFGIEVITGASGDVDQAVAQYLAGELESAGVNCDHHDQEESADSCGCGGNCGGGCGGGCAGGCGGAPQIIFQGPNAGKSVRVHYSGTFNDGTEFDSSYRRGEPLEFTSGVGMMIPGFDKAVVDMEVGQIVNIHLMPEEAYGPVDPNAIITLEVANLPGSENLTVGERVYLTNNYGQQFPVIVTAREGDSITFDANHEMAGKELNFRIELVSVQ